MLASIKENLVPQSSSELETEAYHDVSKSYYCKETENSSNDNVPLNEAANSDFTYVKETSASINAKGKKGKEPTTDSINVKYVKSTNETADVTSMPLIYSAPEPFYIKKIPNQTTKTIYYTYHNCLPPAHTILTTPVTLPEKKVYEIIPYTQNKVITYIPHLDVFFDQEANEILFYVDLPDFEKSQIIIELENNMLTISGERQESKDTKDDKVFRRLIIERVHGYFCRRFCLPNDIVKNSIKANMDLGVLKIQIKCNEDKNRKKIAID